MAFLETIVMICGAALLVVISTIGVLFGIRGIVLIIKHWNEEF